MAYDPFAHSIQLEGQAIDPPVVFFDDFLTAGYNGEASSGKFSETADDCEWLVTKIDGATDNDEALVVSDAEPGGVLTITTTDADNDSLELQKNGEAFQVQANKDIRFKARLKLTSTTTPTTTIDWFIGLANTDTTVMAGCTDAIGFHGGTTILMANQGAANIIATTASVLGSDWTSTSLQTAADTGVDFEDDTFFTVEFEVTSNSRVRFWVNGARVHESVTNIPGAVELTPTMCILNNGAEAKTMEVDYIYCRQER